MEFLVVALGGAVGAMARYAISLIPVKSGFPFLTLVTNIMGALLIGFVVGIASGKNEVSSNKLYASKENVEKVVKPPHTPVFQNNIVFSDTSFLPLAIPTRSD